MKVAKAWNKTIACPECGSWDAVWTSRFVGHDVEHQGDLALWCSKCSKVYDLMLCDVEDVRMSPDDTDWRERKVWYHYGSTEWWDECPDDVLVHVGRRETSLWLYGIRASNDETFHGGRLHEVEVVGGMPSEFSRDVGDGWGSDSVAYVNEYETPGAVSLYLPKGRLKLIGFEDM